MYRFISCLFAVAFIASAAAFQFAPHKAIAPSQKVNHPFHSASAPVSPTALSFGRPKVDVTQVKETKKVNPATFKNIAYVGSVAVAFLLPVIFLVAASK